MPPISLAEPTGRYLSFVEREEIALLHAQDVGVREIARRIGSDPDGTIVAGPDTPAWKGLNKPHRQDRRWSTSWSPEQISHRLEVEFPDDESMRISHEATSQSLFIEGRGALKRDLDPALLPLHWGLRSLTASRGLHVAY